jgi:hypothetical protein
MGGRPQIAQQPVLRLQNLETFEGIIKHLHDKERKRAHQATGTGPTTSGSA